MLTSKLSPNLVFHNLHHTTAVAAAAMEIGTGSGLQAEELELVTVAAWFHDTGYSCRYAGHEDASKQIASRFLRAQGVSAQVEALVTACIEVTKQPQKPGSLAEQVLCDADLSHLGKRCFQVASQHLKKEIEAVRGIPIPDREWHRQNACFLESHTFFTPFALRHYEEQKRINLQRERKLLC
ncbi:HD domain-containing protein [Pontibacter sp. E15-1]|uniref:HD domain-containing protein n=1 Tax=Pontibacter sp. E15-1 TaxID=2919918 RepID=UPI001F4FF6A8|nr:HD domain-containing protein [Pontibacter sp. E15-1]MCJ8164621.1 HD domain-containing protein [Pontibacter sp. E15-1]